MRGFLSSQMYLPGEGTNGSPRMGHHRHLEAVIAIFPGLEKDPSSQAHFQMCTAFLQVTNAAPVPKPSRHRGEQPTNHPSSLSQVHLATLLL